MYESEQFRKLRWQCVTKMRGLRAEGFKVFYTGESRIWSGMSRANDWIHDSNLQGVPSCDPPHHSVYTTPSMLTEKAAVIVHCLGEGGFLEGAGQVYISGGSDDDGDYHREMTIEMYEDWVAGVLNIIARGTRKRLW